jgi:hypothetical protein
MSRLLVPLVVAAALVCSSPAFSQTAPPAGAPIARPGAPTPGAQLPGMPPRDNNRAAPQTGTAKIRGRVVAAQTGQPLRRAQVTLSGTPTSPLPVRRTTTDADGRYEFAELPAGSFGVTAIKTGYVNLQYGQRRPFEQGTPIAIADGQTIDRIDLALPRGSVISVRLTDDFGEPLSGAQVQVQRYQYQADGQRRLAGVQMGGSGLAFTDDRGELRLFGLMPGEYVVSATLRSGGTPGGSPSDNSEGFSPTFYPGVIGAAQAVPISVAVGEEASVQFSMVASRLARISGSVFDSEGRPAAGAGLSLVTRSGTSMTSSSAGTVGPDGRFAIGGVSPGDHTIDVRPRITAATGASPTAESASFPISVSGADINDVRIVTGRGTMITGKVVFEGTASREMGTSPLPMRVTMTQADPSRQLLAFPGADPLANGTVDDDGDFQLSGATGRVFVNVTMPPLWVLKSVTLDGATITDDPLDLTGKASISGLVITLTDKLTTIAGQVGDGRGQVLRDYVVVIQPAEELEAAIAARRIRVVRPSTDGRFETRGLRPGRYIATAIEALEQGRQFAPEFQQQLRRGAREFTVGEGQAVTVDLRLTPDL